MSRCVSWPTAALVASNGGNRDLALRFASLPGNVAALCAVAPGRPLLPSLPDRDRAALRVHSRLLVAASRCCTVRMAAMVGLWECSATAWRGMVATCFDNLLRWSQRIMEGLAMYDAVLLTGGRAKILRVPA